VVEVYTRVRRHSLPTHAHAWPSSSHPSASSQLHIYKFMFQIQIVAVAISPPIASPRCGHVRIGMFERGRTRVSFAKKMCGPSRPHRKHTQWSKPRLA
jgi:hypothetical protein